jgi:hypothetical protein
MTEQQLYTVLDSRSGFELRRYPQHLIAEVTVSASFEDAGNRAFRYLFGYISGSNVARKKVAMTAPVVQSAPSESIAMTSPVVQRSSDGGRSHTVAFVLPEGMTQETAPVPESSEVRIRTVPASLSAALGYRGRWTEASYVRHVAELRTALADAGFTALGSPRLARFDPPFKPAFLRRNEVVIDIVDPG